MGMAAAERSQRGDAALPDAEELLQGVVIRAHMRLGGELVTLCHVVADRISAALDHVPPYHAAAGDRTGADQASGKAAGVVVGIAVAAVGIAVAAGAAGIAVAAAEGAEGDHISAAEALQHAAVALGLVSIKTRKQSWLIAAIPCLLLRSQGWVSGNLQVQAQQICSLRELATGLSRSA